MAGQDVFKGALGWDDWIWWSGIGGLGLLLLMLVLCCIVCVQRAKRKGRAEALAAVQTRERERQQQEQAQLRYAQAQQARYPAREPSFRFSKPEPPQPTYNPYGEDDHSMRNNSFLNNAPAPRPKPRRGSQQPGQDEQQQQQQQQYNAPVKQQQQQFYTVPPSQPPVQQQQQQQQQFRYSRPQPQERAPQQQQQRQEPEELPQVAAYYGRKPTQQAQQQAAPPVYRQQAVNPNQPPIMHYRKTSSRTDSISTPFGQDEISQGEVPFVQVTTPRNSSASTASSAVSAAAPARPNAGNDLRGSSVSSASSSMVRVGGGTTLRDRIDALRDGPPQGPAVSDNYTRASASSASSAGHSLPPPPPYQPPAPAPVPANAAAPRRVEAFSDTMLSDSSSTTNDFAGTSQYGDAAAFDEEAFNTARSHQGRAITRHDSGESLGVDEEAYYKPARGRTNTGDSTGSIEF